MKDGIGHVLRDPIAAHGAATWAVYKCAAAGTTRTAGAVLFLS